METIQQLMVAMTFSDGNAAISPKCWHRDRAWVSLCCCDLSPGSGFQKLYIAFQLGRSHCRELQDQQSGKDCGAPLWPIPESVGLQCRRRCLEHSRHSYPSLVLSQNFFLRLKLCAQADAAEVSCESEPQLWALQEMRQPGQLGMSVGNQFIGLKVLHKAVLLVACGMPHGSTCFGEGYHGPPGSCRLQAQFWQFQCSRLNMPRSIS